MIFQEYFGISCISEYSYCPRSFAYSLIQFKPQEEENFYIIDGRIDHERLSEKPTSYNRKGEQELREFRVKSDKLMLNGKIDRLVKNGNIFSIIEEKRGKTRENNQHVLQVQLQAYCLQEMNPDAKIQNCSVYYQGSRRKLEVDWSLEIKSKIENYVNEVLNKIKNFELDNFEAVLDQRCYGCMFQDICGVE